MGVDHEGVLRAQKKEGSLEVNSLLTREDPFSSVEKFSPNDAIERTYRARFSLPQRAQPAKTKLKPKRTPRIQEFLRRAEEYRRMLDREAGLSLRKLAVRLEMKPERLCQILNLLKLAPTVRRAIRALPRTAGRERVTEYGLRRVASLPTVTAQMRAYRALAED
ncbi:MAG: hypothetical protein HYX59_03975 [Elusimicrobia bacterium]|nr:hypothetical protein [Elusimicrobiota bacterium]